MRCTTLSIVCLTPLLLAFGALIHDLPRNPAVNPDSSIEKALEVPPRVQTFLRRSCYDCHSSETRWPWYAGVPPVSGLIESDVKHGRAAMNLSEWSTSSGASALRAAATLAAACSAVRSGIMPKRPYTYLHPEAHPSRSEIEMFCEWTREQDSQLRTRTRTRSNQAACGIHN